MTLMRRSYQSTKTFPVGDFDDKKWREYQWAYYRMTEMVDTHIGKVLGALRNAGAEENTLVVFTADHGDCQGAHGWNQKTVFYEESARPPFILSYQGVTKPGVSGRLVNTGVDLFPTLCDYAGIESPGGLPGLSLKDTANGDTQADPREYVVVSNKLVQGAPVDGKDLRPDGRMLRTDRYKYSVYNEGEHRESLVDLENDPGEMVNLAGILEHQETLQRHRGLLAAWCRQYGDAFPVPA